MNIKFCVPVIACLTLLVSTDGRATEMVYTPVNPSFGGSPLNGPVLLNSANAQNSHKAPASSSALSGNTRA